MFQFYLSSIKRKNPKTGKLEPFMFQFYLSSIKREGNFIKKWDCIQFQFYLSSIKSSSIYRLSTSKQRFNSTLVQLKAFPTFFNGR